MQIIVGFRTAMAYGWRALVAGEMIAGTSGLGYMTIEAVQWYRTETVLVGMIVIGLIWLMHGPAHIRAARTGHGATLGNRAAMSVSFERLGLGGAALGVLFQAVDDADAIATIEAAWAAGIRKYDTSPLYGGGLSEERLGRVLSNKPRREFQLSTKTGVNRPYGQAAAPPGRARRSADVWDYSPEGTRRSIDASRERLRTNKLDLVHLHDVEGRTVVAMSAYSALNDLRERGIIAEIGIGANTVDAPLDLMARGRFDAVLVAGRYTLLDQSMLRLVPVAEHARTRLIVGGVFNSGILATGAIEGATFHYDPAPPDILERVRAIEAISRAHDVPLRAAALQFPLAHPAVTTLLLGARSPAELADALEMLTAPIPPKFWRSLQVAGLLDRACPLP